MLTACWSRSDSTAATLLCLLPALLCLLCSTSCLCSAPSVSQRSCSPWTQPPARPQSPCTAKMVRCVALCCAVCAASVPCSPPPAHLHAYLRVSPSPQPPTHPRPRPCRPGEELLPAHHGQRDTAGTAYLHTIVCSLRSSFEKLTNSPTEAKARVALPLLFQTSPGPPHPRRPLWTSVSLRCA
jgi:hypothetical protein